MMRSRTAPFAERSRASLCLRDELEGSRKLNKIKDDTSGQHLEIADWQPRSGECDYEEASVVAPVLPPVVQRSFTCSRGRQYRRNRKRSIRRRSGKREDHRYRNWYWPRARHDLRFPGLLRN